MLPYALWSTSDGAPHGDAATEAAGLADELIGLLQGGLAGKRWPLDGGGCHGLCDAFLVVEYFFSMLRVRGCGEAYGHEDGERGYNGSEKMLWIRISTRQQHPIGSPTRYRFPCRCFSRIERLMFSHVAVKDLVGGVSNVHWYKWISTTDICLYVVYNCCCNWGGLMPLH